MYLEGSKRFLLSGKQFGMDLFLISLHEDFPFIESRTNRGHVAKVVRQRDASFLISLNCCHLCDHKLGLYTCGRGLGQREVVAKISHSIRRFRSANADMRCILATIPYILPTGRRDLWCPRSLREASPNMPMSADVNEFLAMSPGIGLRYVNRLPDWSKDLECLVLKFQGNRILSASSKNFLLQEEPAKELGSPLDMLARDTVAGAAAGSGGITTPKTTSGNNKNSAASSSSKKKHLQSWKEYTETPTEPSCKFPSSFCHISNIKMLWRAVG